MLPEQKLDALLARHKALESELATPLPRETYIKLSREFAELGPIVETVKEYRSVAAEIEGLEVLMKDPATDAEMREMAGAQRPAPARRASAPRRPDKVA